MKHPVEFHSFTTLVDQVLSVLKAEILRCGTGEAVG
jgi:hypothetical protein